MLKLSLYACVAALLAGCVSPLAREVRETIAPDLEFAAVQADPQSHLGQSLMLGGSIVNLIDDDQGSQLEILRWDLNRWGEPLKPTEAGDRFLVRASRILDADRYTRGRLVTLGGTLRGTASVLVNEQEKSVLLLELLDIHLWDTPFRYGLHQNLEPGDPEYHAPTKPGQNHPYDPTPWSYPYTPFWYRTR